MSDAPHTPVLVAEVLHYLEGVPLRRFFDGTLGAGGHAEAILTAHPEIEHYLGCDRDEEALRLAKTRLAPFGKKVEFLHGEYDEVVRYVRERGWSGIDGFLIDVGVSSMQLDQGERGFSFQCDAPLDMRMNREAQTTAAEIVNKWSETRLAQILYEWGEERRSRQVAKAIVEARRKKPIRTTGELVKIISPVATKGRLHPATLTFQALRIAVNDELGQLQRGLEGALQIVEEGGRILVISFHSLEDRIAKEAFREGKERIKILTKKPVVATREEIRRNPRARSAKLRVAERDGNEE